MENIIIQESKYYKINHHIVIEYNNNNIKIRFGFMFYNNNNYDESNTLYYLRRDIKIEQDLHKDINIIDIVKKMIQTVEKHYNIKLKKVFALDYYNTPEQPHENEIIRMKGKNQKWII